MPRCGGLISVDAGTVTVDFFLASSVASKEGGVGGLRGDLAIGAELGEGKEDTVGDGFGSFALLCTSSFMQSFLEVMLMD